MHSSGNCTPGPWEVTLQRDCGKQDTTHVIIFGEDDAPVCEVFGNSTTVDSNARLIASAPDLLAACEGTTADYAIADTLDQLGDELGRLGLNILARELRQRTQNRLTAVSKAKGA